VKFLPEESTNSLRTSWSPRRILTVFGLLILIVGLLWYGKAKNPTITLQMCLAAPQRYDGSLIEVGTEATVAQVIEDGFILRQMGKLVKVVGKANDLQVGEFVGLLAVFHRPGLLELKKIHVAKNRRTKIWVSVIPLVMVLLFCIRQYRVDFRRLGLTERNPCRT